MRVRAHPTVVSEPARCEVCEACVAELVDKLLVSEGVAGRGIVGEQQVLIENAVDDPVTHVDRRPDHGALDLRVARREHRGQAVTRQLRQRDRAISKLLVVAHRHEERAPQPCLLAIARDAEPDKRADQRLERHARPALGDEHGRCRRLALATQLDLHHVEERVLVAKPVVERTDRRIRLARELGDRDLVERVPLLEEPPRRMDDPRLRVARPLLMRRLDPPQLEVWLGHEPRIPRRDRR